MERISGLVSLFVLLLSSPSPAQDPAAIASSQQTSELREAQYVALQADLFDEPNLTAPSGVADQVARLLRDLRGRFPVFAELRIPSQMTSRTSLILTLEPRYRRNVDRLCDAWEGYSRARSQTLGIPEADTLTRKFGGAYEVTCRGRGSSVGPFVVVNFPRLLHVPSLAKLYRETAGVLSAENDRVILGGVTPVSVAQENGGWRVTFGKGAGDCPAGCTYREYHRFLVAADGAVEYLGPERQGELPTPVIEQDSPEGDLPDDELPERDPRDEHPLQEDPLQKEALPQ